ncbi:hypothetical protein SprV_0100389800 [Sparganum proliferum]
MLSVLIDGLGARHKWCRPDAAVGTKNPSETNWCPKRPLASWAGREWLIFGVAMWGQLRSANVAFDFGSGAAVGSVNPCTSRHSSPPSRSIPGEMFPISRVDLQTPRGSLQGILVVPDLASLAAGSRGDISIEESFGYPFVVHLHQMAAPAQLQLSQHSVDAEDSRPFQYVRVRDPVQANSGSMYVGDS